MEITRTGVRALGWNGQAVVHVEIRLARDLERPDKDAFEQLIPAWYRVGFHGGYEGASLNQLDDVAVGDRAVRFRLVAGGDCGSALDVLARCIDEMQQEDLIDVVSVTTTERPYS